LPARQAQLRAERRGRLRHQADQPAGTPGTRRSRPVALQEKVSPLVLIAALALPGPGNARAAEYGMDQGEGLTPSGMSAKTFGVLLLGEGGDKDWKEAADA